MSKCDTCVQDKSECSRCYDSPKVQAILATLPKKSYYIAYVPACPYNYMDCIHDPAYMKCYEPKEYYEEYGDITPREAINVDGLCLGEYQRDPCGCRYYDDEDK